MIERGNANGMKLIRTTALLTFGFNPSSKMGLLHLMQEPELVPIEGVSNDFAAQILNSIAVTLNNSAETFKKESNKEAGRKIVNLINDGIASAYNKALQFAKYKDTKSLIQYNQAVWLIDNQPNEAEPLLLNRLKALEESYGNQSPKLESVLATLTHMYAFSQDKEKSSFYAKRLMRCTQNRIEQILSFTSESERQSTLINPGRYNAFVAAGNPNLLAEFVLKSKGMILDSMMEEKAFLKLAMKPKLKNLFLEIKRTEQLHRIALQNLNSTPLTATLNVKADPDKLNLALKELKKKATLEFSRENPVRKIFKFEVSDLQKKIGANAVMLEFISFDKKIDSWLWERRYGVLIIPAYNLNLPIQWVDLGLAKTIDSEVNKFMELISSENSFNAKKNLQKLYSQLFARLIKLIPEDVNTLIFSPDSSLNFVPFGCLIDTDGKFLSETYGVKYVSTGRDLLDLNIAESKSEGDMVIFANPDFKNEKTGIEIIGSKQELAILHSGLRELSFNPLPGTMLEASALSSIANENKMKVKVYHGRDAKEESLMKIHSPKILHLATHGFFLPVNSQEQKTPFSHRANRKINSMNRGGLLLSGAQKNFELYSKGKNISKSSDGILTAEEVKGLDLSGTWLTSLSACDTASGTVLDGEGVLGLRRSFVQAGTQNLLLTLWSVDDSFTKDFMVSFYKEALKTGNAPKAMAKVQKEWLIKLREERSVSQAVKLAGPFVLTFRGNPELN